MSYNKFYDKIDFVKHRKKFFAFSAISTIIGIISLFVMQLNFGVDFKSGTTLDIALGKASSKEVAETLLQEIDVEPSVITAGEQRVTLRFDKVIQQDETSQIISKFKAEYGDQVSYEENTVDVEMAKELALRAIQAVLIAGVGIMIYISIRFEWRFAVGAIVALFYDAFFVITLFSLFRFEVNLPFVAAVLTIVGYSINDTIVIFDRIRENMRFSKLKTFQDLSDLVNLSVRQTMTRSINTVLTVLFAAFCLFIFGSESIRLFSLAMVFGLISGAYSSVFIASPLWLVLKSKSLGKDKVRKADM